MSDSANSSGPRGDADMPRPSSSTPAGGAGRNGMPTPTSTSGGPADGMPRPGGAPSSGPASAETSAPASGGMPTPGRGSAEPPATALPRFGPPGGAGTDGPRYEPGVVEVQFREGVAPTVAPDPDGALVARAVSGDPMSGMNQILERHGLVQAEPTFDISAEDAVAAREVATSTGIDAPELSSFVTLHFPEDADSARIAAEIRQLPEVEQAMPVPVALPPTAVLPGSAPTAPPAAPPAPAEPLTGNSNQVVLDTVTGLENQWYILRCHVDQAWPRSTGRNVVVADIDWGYRTSHEDLTGRITRACNPFDNTNDVTHGGSISHGTAVLGLAGAAVNGRGMAGIA